MMEYSRDGEMGEEAAKAALDGSEGK